MRLFHNDSSSDDRRLFLALLFSLLVHLLLLFFVRFVQPGWSSPAPVSPPLRVRLEQRTEPVEAAPLPSIAEADINEEGTAPVGVQDKAPQPAQPLTSTQRTPVEKPPAAVPETFAKQEVIAVEKPSKFQVVATPDLLAQEKPPVEPAKEEAPFAPAPGVKKATPPAQKPAEKIVAETPVTGEKQEKIVVASGAEMPKPVEKPVEAAPPPTPEPEKKIPEKKIPEKKIPEKKIEEPVKVEAPKPPEPPKQEPPPPKPEPKPEPPPVVEPPPPAPPKIEPPKQEPPKPVAIEEIKPQPVKQPPAVEKLTPVEPPRSEPTRPEPPKPTRPVVAEAPKPARVPIPGPPPVANWGAPDLLNGTPGPKTPGLADLGIASIRKMADDDRRMRMGERRKVVDLNEKDLRYSMYVESVRMKLQRIGQFNYPAEAARNNLSGSLSLVISIRSDGSLEGIDIVRPAPYAVLDEGARKIVKMCAPFPPLPDDIKRETDTLSIRIRWNFSREQASLE